MGKYLSEELNVRIGLAPDADRWASDPASDVFNMKDYETIMFIVSHAEGATGTVVVTVEECTANDGTGATAIPFKYRKHGATATAGALTDATASGVTIAAGSDQLLLVEVSSEDLSEDSPYVRVQCTEGVDSPVDGAVIVVQGKPRQSSGTPVAALT